MFWRMKIMSFDCLSSFTSCPGVGPGWWLRSSMSTPHLSQRCVLISLWELQESRTNTYFHGMLQWRSLVCASKRFFLSGPCYWCVYSIQQCYGRYIPLHILFTPFWCLQCILSPVYKKGSMLGHNTHPPLPPLLHPCYLPRIMAAHQWPWDSWQVEPEYCTLLHKRMSHLTVLQLVYSEAFLEGCDGLTLTIRRARWGG